MCLNMFKTHIFPNATGTQAEKYQKMAGFCLCLSVNTRVPVDNLRSSCMARG